MNQNSFNKFQAFARQADSLLDLARAAIRVPDAELPGFIENQRRIWFLRDLSGRIRVLGRCYETLHRLSDQMRSIQEEYDTLPRDDPDSMWRTIPEELLFEENECLVQVDAYTSLIYYEVTSVVHILRQLGISIENASEVRYLVKIRDRFFSHVQLSGVRRGKAEGWALPDAGYLRRDVVKLSSWSPEDQRFLGPLALEIGSTEWHERRRENKALVLSSKRNEEFTPDELGHLLAAGVRECDLVAVHNQLGELLLSDLLSIVVAESDRSVSEFGYVRFEG